MPFLSRNQTITIVAVDFPPVTYVQSYLDDPYGEGNLWGLFGWLISNVTKALGARMKVMRPRDRQFGVYYNNGTLTGQYRELQDGFADILAGPSARDEFLDTLLPFSEPYSCNRAWGLISGMKHAFTTNPMPYDASAAVFLGGAAILCLLVSLIAFLIQYGQKSGRENKLSLEDTFWLFVMSLFLEATYNPVRNFHLRVVYGMWLLMMVVLSTYITSEMRSSSMLQTPTPRINSVEQILKNPKIRFICLQEMSIFITDKTWLSRLKADEGIKSAFEIISDDVTFEILKGKAVAIFSLASYIDLVRDTFCPNPEYEGYFHFATQRITYEPICVFRFRKNFNKTIVKEFNKRLRWLEETNVQWYERGKFDIRRLQCVIQTNQDGTRLSKISESFRFENIKPVMFLWLILLGVSTVVLIAERFVHCAQVKIQ